MRERDARYQQFYTALRARLQSYPKVPAVLRFCDRLFVGIIALGYLILALSLLVIDDKTRLMQIILVPGASFLIVSLLRRGLDAPRPYESCKIEPLIETHTKGRSFPSRHAFSAAVIASAVFYAAPSFGALFFFLALGVSVIRIIGGAHFPRDVIAGLASGFICGAIGFWLL
jgi:membrane-associated phospholipid phosphatase